MRQIANYTIEDTPIARGGMGQIFRGRDSQGKIVAIKEILPEFANDWAILSRIEKEVEFLLKVNHPSIVKLYAAFRDDATQNYYIVMELVEGLNIEQYVTKHGAIPEQQAVELMLKILDALQCVHNAHIVHRDIKPSNIMIRPDGNVCLLDFGVAKDMDNTNGSTIVGSIIGTNGYMSPEQADGFSINFRSDIYSLGCVFYYMLTGHHAFNTLASEFETKDAILNNEFPRLSKYKSGLSDILQKVLDKATNKNMMLRYQNCYEFMAALSNGTHVSHTGTLAPVLISIGREMCDIIINDADRKISRHHADVELKEFTGGKYYVFTDCSANGTVVNRKPLRKSSISIPANDPAPEIYLAGVVDGHLDWDKVVDELNKRAQAAQEVANEPKTEILEKPKPSSLEDKPKPEYQYEPDEATGWLVTAFIFAVLLPFFGIAFGVMVWSQKIKLDNGSKVYKYKETHRYLGLVATVIAIISVFIWKFAVYN